MLLLGKDHLGPDVVHTIERMGDGVIPMLGTIATGEQPADEYERENAIYVLGMIGQDQAVDYLSRVLWSPDLNLQVLAARALGRIGSPEALAELQRLYKGYRLPAPIPAPPTAADSDATRPAADRVKEPARRALPRPIPAPLALELRDILGPQGNGGDGQG